MVHGAITCFWDDLYLYTDPCFFRGGCQHCFKICGRVDHMASSLWLGSGVQKRVPFCILCTKCTTLKKYICKTRGSVGYQVLKAVELLEALSWKSIPTVLPLTPSRVCLLELNLRPCKPPCPWIHHWLALPRLLTCTRWCRVWSMYLSIFHSLQSVALSCMLSEVLSQLYFCLLFCQVSRAVWFVEFFRESLASILSSGENLGSRRFAVLLAGIFQLDYCYCFQCFNLPYFPELLRLGRVYKRDPLAIAGTTFQFSQAWCTSCGTTNRIKALEALTWTTEIHPPDLVLLWSTDWVNWLEVPRRPLCWLSSPMPVPMSCERGYLQNKIHNSQKYFTGAPQQLSPTCFELVLWHN